MRVCMFLYLNQAKRIDTRRHGHYVMTFNEQKIKRKIERGVSVRSHHILVFIYDKMNDKMFTDIRKEGNKVYHLKPPLWEALK